MKFKNFTNKKSSKNKPLSFNTLSFFVFIILTIGFSNNLFSAVVTWTGAVDNDWNEAGNWSGNIVPDGNDEVTIQGAFTVNLDYTAGRNVGSLTIIDASLTIANSTTLNVLSLNVPTIGFALHINNTTIVNNGNLYTNGGMWVENHSSVTNNGTIRDFGAYANADYNFFIDTESICINNVNKNWIGGDNIFNGVNKLAMLTMDNKATFLNYGRFYNQWTSLLGDYLVNGIILDNGSMFKNLDGFINMNWIQQRVILLKNDPLSVTKTTFENHVWLRMRETDVDTDNTSIAIETHPNTTFKFFPGGFILMTYTAIVQGGFLNTTPQIVNNGAILFNSTVAAPFSPQNLSLSSGSTFGGIGPINNADISYLGGTVSPGESPGIITMNDDFNPGASTSFEMELAGTSGAGASTGHDQIVLAGTTNDISNVNLNVSLIDGFVPSVGDAFVLFSGSYTGTLANFNVPGEASSWGITYNANDVTLTLLSALQNIGNIGLGTDDPKTKVHVKDGDVYLETPGSGVIMKDANGDCRKLTVDGSGNITAALINCPQ